MIRDIRRGTSVDDAIQKAMDAGVAEADIARAVNAAGISPLLATFKGRTVAEARRAWPELNDEQRELLRASYATKLLGEKIATLERQRTLGTITPKGLGELHSLNKDRTTIRTLERMMINPVPGRTVNENSYRQTIDRLLANHGIYDLAQSTPQAAY